MPEINTELEYGINKLLEDWLKEKPELSCEICNKLLAKSSEIHFVSINNIRFYLFCSENCLKEWGEQHNL